MAVTTYTVSSIVLPDETLTALDWSAMETANHQIPQSVTTDVFPNTGNEFFYVKNNNATAAVVTVYSNQPCVFGTDHDIVVSVAQDKALFFGKFPVNRFGTTVSVGYTGAGMPGGLTDLEVDVVRV